jgi:hypothetical protein
MKESESLRSRALREIREDLRRVGIVNVDIYDLDSKMLAEIKWLPKYVEGEKILRRYAAAGVERRLADLEKRVTALEEQP